MKRHSLKFDELDQRVLLGIAHECGCQYQGNPSWRRLIHKIVTGDLTVLNKPDQCVREFQAELRQPMLEQRQKQAPAKRKAQAERDRLRQEQKRRAAGIAPSGAQEALEIATGYRNECGILNPCE